MNDNNANSINELAAALAADEKAVNDMDVFLDTLEHDVKTEDVFSLNATPTTGTTILKQNDTNNYSNYGNNEDSDNDFSLITVTGNEVSALNGNDANIINEIAVASAHDEHVVNVMDTFLDDLVAEDDDVSLFNGTLTINASTSVSEILKRSDNIIHFNYNDGNIWKGNDDTDNDNSLIDDDSNKNSFPGISIWIPTTELWGK